MVKYPVCDKTCHGELIMSWLILIVSGVLVGLVALVLVAGLWPR